MDDSSFDRLTRVLTETVSRRGLGGLAGTLAALSLTAEAEAKKKGNKKKRKKKKAAPRCADLFADCGTGDDCCTGTCCVNVCRFTEAVCCTSLTLGTLGACTEENPVCCPGGCCTVDFPVCCGEFCCPTASPVCCGAGCCPSGTTCDGSFCIPDRAAPEGAARGAPPAPARPIAHPD